MSRRDHQKGAALLSILMIVAALSVAALVAVSAIARQTDLSKAASRRADAGWAVYSAEAIALSAITTLQRDAGNQSLAVRLGLGETQMVPVQGGVVSLQVSDATNCFNVNALAGPEEGAARLARLGWSRLLQDLGLSVADANDLTDALADWIDADSTPRRGGAEDGYYLTLSPPYRAANQPMDSPRELAAVRGYTGELREALAPLACTLQQPSLVRLNVDTLTPQQAPLLRASYSDAIGLAAAERILANRPMQGWGSVDAFETLPDIRAIPPGQKRTDMIGVTSNLFLVEGFVALDAGRWPFSFMIQSDGGQSPRIVWRRMGEE
ncbi:MAG: type II secretion system minor pseudopilin GspK [Hyphomonas sp.]